jgi:hypothetical protein
MSKDDELRYSWPVPEDNKRVADQAAALLGLSDGGHAIGEGLKIVFAHAKAHARGKTQIVFCTPEVKALINNNPKFIEALCEEGVVEWLTPFVLTKSKQSTTDTDQP